MIARSLLLPAATLFALLAGTSAEAASATPSPTDGFVFVSVGAGQVTDNFSGDARGVSITGGTSIEHSFDSMLGFQGDVVLRRISQTEFGTTAADMESDAAVHLFYRDPGSFLIGAFGQLGAEDFDGAGFFPSSTTRSYAGLEGQAYFGQATLYGQLAAQHQDFFFGTADGYVATVEGAYFLTPNFRVEAHAGIDHLNGNSSFDPITQYKAGLGAEYRFDGSPLSIFAKYDFTHRVFDNYTGYVVNDNRVSVGLRFNFDDTTLEDRNTGGASLKPIDVDPIFVVPQS